MLAVNGCLILFYNAEAGYNSQYNARYPLQRVACIH